jgi:putative oxidoreductase
VMLDLGLLALRVFAGLTLALVHGLPKLQNFAAYATQFPDPLGAGAKFSLVLAIFGELICGILVALGLAARLSAIPAAITMFVAYLVIHAADPFQKKELALVYGVMFVVLALTGPGRFSLDAVIGAKRRVSQYRP